jgi:hypothetical protein
LAVASSDGLEEAADGDPYRIQWQAWRRPVPVRPYGDGVVATVPGVVLQARGDRTGSTVTGMASRRPSVMV